MAREGWPKTLGRNIREYRKKAGLTQQETADRYGCALRRWQGLEQGRAVTLRVLIKVAEVLGVSASRLMKGIGPGKD